MFVPDDFDVPTTLDEQGFRLEPLGPQHNDADYAAWRGSIAHIRATPGYGTRPWPNDEFTIEQNLADLEKHARDFAERTGFTYTVLDPSTGEVIGCVYLYPPVRDGSDVNVRSWVREADAALDKPLHDAVLAWIERDWPFERPDYAAR